MISSVQHLTRAKLAHAYQVIARPVCKGIIFLSSILSLAQHFIDSCCYDILWVLHHREMLVVCHELGHTHPLVRILILRVKVSLQLIIVLTTHAGIGSHLARGVLLLELLRVLIFFLIIEIHLFDWIMTNKIIKSELKNRKSACPICYHTNMTRL